MGCWRGEQEGFQEGELTAVCEKFTDKKVVNNIFIRCGLIV